MDEEHPSNSATQPGPIDQRTSAETRRAVLHIFAGALLCVAVVVFALMTARFALAVKDNSTLDQERDEAVEAARNAAVRISSVSATSAHEDTDEVLDLATGQFRSEYSGQREQFVEFVSSRQVEASATVLDAGLASTGEGLYRVLVALSSDVRDNMSPNAEVRAFRLAVTMTEQNDRWLVERLEYVG